MFPGWTAEQLFAPTETVADRLKMHARNSFGRGELVDSVTAALKSRDISVTGWGPAQTPARHGSSIQLHSAEIDFDSTDLPEDAKRIGRKLAALAQVLRLSQAEAAQLAGLVGNVVELELRIELHIDGDGNSRLVHTHDVFNMSSEPLTRVARQLWFEHAVSSGLRIDPLRRDHRQISIDRTHNAGPTMAKFSCQISPSVQPGESGVISYVCTGGKFVDSLYWRQDILRYTRRLTVVMRQAGGYRLVTCSGEQVRPNGLVVGATEDLLWDYDGDDIVVALTRDYLRPNESVTLRWEIDRDEGTA
ncbi:hypothetical protein [Nocardia nova]|uniref:hypothetical protein n=1 Tax=Nocardia nova TaxID=37330 RepID=UPI0033F57EBC